MIDMHAHWRPAELAEDLRARTREPRLTRNDDGVEVLRTRNGKTKDYSYRFVAPADCGGQGQGCGLHVRHRSDA